MTKNLPPSCRLSINRSGFLTYTLLASQILPISQKEAFKFFENPGNLAYITPPWLDFRMSSKDSKKSVFENAEFEYTIRFLGIKLLWRSRIIDYMPPERFTDIQLKGPYKSWVHRHLLEKAPGGTLIRDEVTYTLHLPALFLHSLVIRKKLMNIFSYRAVKIAEQAEALPHSR